MYIIFFALLSISRVPSLNGHRTNHNPIVNTSCGSIQGSVIRSVLGKSIYSFRGIRYAKAPVDELRFEPPVPAEKWEGLYDATKDGPLCPQPGDIPISEDCLRLNVYTTKLPSAHHNPKRAVMFYMHPGGFYAFSSVSKWTGPQYYLDQDVVLVTINYRLGSLGFLSTGDRLAPGNNGLKDQVVALKWVKENIRAFGGDPNLVTIVGYSAGGVSVASHLLSPMSKGLFHRAIAMSAMVFGQTPIGNHQYHLAQKQARLVGCPDDTSENILKCLRTKSAKELGDSLGGFAEYGSDPVSIWTPVIELDFGQERFFTEHPIKNALNGNFQKVPIMAGITTEEFSYQALGVVNNPQLLREMDEEFDRVAPIAFVYERNTTRSKAISRKLREEFLGPGPLTQSSLKGLGYLYADGVVGFGVNRGIKMLAAKNTECTYYYRFSYPGRFSYFYLPNTTTPYGVTHHDDLIYMFYSEIFPKFNTSDPEYEMVKKLTTLQVNFAYTGNPTPSRSALLDHTLWTPITPRNDVYMDIGLQLKMKKGLYEERYSVWNSLFPLSDFM
uniref:Carboxylic ester hydrolase n=1 Tax=Photinus pyralis TaxID=7054 RepID=A0A1Y1LPN2_PHOPY